VPPEKQCFALLTLKTPLDDCRPLIQSVAPELFWVLHPGSRGAEFGPIGDVRFCRSKLVTDVTPRGPPPAS
jgi:hypothetical protein